MDRAVFIIMTIALVLLASGIPSGQIRADSSDASDRALRIVLDPGHGGRDSGALGPGMVKEKDITLAICRELAARLREKGMDVFLTRTDDTFVPLSERTAFANRSRGDLFLSVHINANEDRSQRGFETFFLSMAADASSLKVAERENASAGKPTSDLQFIIDDLILNGKINESSWFASTVQKSMVSILGGGGYRCRDNGVKQAFFNVLVGAQMPSILIEAGFITNPDECRLLQDRTYQGQLVTGISAGIDSYQGKFLSKNSEKKPARKDQKHTSLGRQKDS